MTHRLWKHKKSGAIVVVRDEGKMQTVEPIGDMTEVTIYTHNGQTWVRPTKEFNDGRFEQVPYDRQFHD